MAAVPLLTVAPATVDGQAVIALNVSVISHVLLLFLKRLIKTANWHVAAKSTATGSFDMSSIYFLDSCIPILSWVLIIVCSHSVCTLPLLSCSYLFTNLCKRKMHCPQQVFLFNGMDGARLLTTWVWLACNHINLSSLCMKSARQQRQNMILGGGVFGGYCVPLVVLVSAAKQLSQWLSTAGSVQSRMSSGTAASCETTFLFCFHNRKLFTAHLVVFSVFCGI